MTAATATRETPQQAARRLLAGALREGFEPVALHTYRDANGAPLFWKARLKHPDGRKEIRPIRWNGERFELGEPPAPPQGKPLYRLHELAARPGEPVIVVEGESCADALAALGLLATTSGGADSAARADWQPLAGRGVLIWPDHDAPGQRYALDVAERAQVLGCTVRLVDVAALGLSPKDDTVNWLGQHPDADAAAVLALATVEPPGAQADALPPLPPKAAVERARGLLLADPEPAEDAYPLAALGPLAEAARAIAEGAQVRPAMAGQAVLTAAALLASRVANVRSLDGSAKPLGLYALTVALSGDGKDAADRPALAAVHAWQREHQAAGRTDHWLLASDVTAEGLRRSFKEGTAAQGIFTAEAGQILAGHAMSAENRTKTAAVLCALFDRGHLSVVRAGEGRTERYGVRLSAHLLVQPVALGDTLADEGLSGVGLWPRFLLAWPAPLAPRVHRPWRADQCPAVGHYWKRCRELLDTAAPDDCDSLPTVELDAEALLFVAGFFERMEIEARRGGLRDVRPWALRATELLCRVAGVLTVWAGADEIDADTARSAAQLVTASLDAWQAARDGRADPAPAWALTLYQWLAERGEPVAIKDIPRLGPASLRSAARRNAATDRLEAAGLVAIDSGEIFALGVDHAGK